MDYNLLFNGLIVGIVFGVFIGIIIFIKTKKHTISKYASAFSLCMSSISGNGFACKKHYQLWSDVYHSGKPILREEKHE